jgi:hypothetical protein
MTLPDGAGPFPGDPGRHGIDEVLRLADAYPLLTHLADLVEKRTGEDRETVIFGILDGVQDRLDTGNGPAGVNETVYLVRGWFVARIAEEEQGPEDGA